MSGPSDEDLVAAELLLRRLGVSAQDLLGRPVAASSAPTFAEYIPVVEASMPSGQTRDCYTSYWNQLLNRADWRDRRIDEPTVSEFRTLILECLMARRVRKTDRGGRGAGRSFVSALRRLYRAAEDDRIIDRNVNPARRLEYPPNLPSRRQPLRNGLLAQINQVAATTGMDPELDVLMLRLHTETACRRRGAMALRPRDLDVERCQVWLREKGGVERWQPVSPTLLKALVRFSQSRGVAAEAQLLVNRHGRPITRSKYTRLWGRLGSHIPEVAERGITTHWIRHTTLTWVERNFGYSVSTAYGGHSFNTNISTTMIYTKASIHEIAHALAAMTGEPHPLALDSA